MPVPKRCENCNTDEGVSRQHDGSYLCDWCFIVKQDMTKALFEGRYSDALDARIALEVTNA